MVSCERCSIYFYTQAEYDRHTRSSSSHHICAECGIDWPTWVRLKEHYIQSPRHDFCKFCEEHFDDEYDHRRHNDEYHWWCRTCNVFFPRGGELGLQEHNRQTHADRWCLPCKKLFSSPSNLSAVSEPRSFIKITTLQRARMQPFLCVFIGHDAAFGTRHMRLRNESCAGQ